MSQEEAVGITERALVLGVNGDLMAAGRELAPLIADCNGSAYALAGMLAEVASHIIRREQNGNFFGLDIENAKTGESASVDSMAPDRIFAARFVTAWANRDLDTTDALFVTLVKAAQPNGPELTGGIYQLFCMAVATATAVVEEQRAQRTTTD